MLQHDGWPVRYTACCSAYVTIPSLVNGQAKWSTGQSAKQQVDHLANKRGDSEVANEVACESVNALDVAHKVARTIDDEVAIFRA